MSSTTGPVQSLSGIALMLDAVARLARRRRRRARPASCSRASLERQRDTIRSLRDLSFDARADHPARPGLRPRRPGARRAARHRRTRSRIDLDVDAGEALAERAQVALYQIIRDALHQALRRGPPTRISVDDRPRLDDGGVETRDRATTAPASGARRVWEAIEERARALNGAVDGREPASGGGTIVRVVAAAIHGPLSIAPAMADGRPPAVRLEDDGLRAARRRRRRARAGRHARARRRRQLRRLEGRPVAAPGRPAPLRVPPADG